MSRNAFTLTLLLALAGCTVTVDERSLLHPTPGGALPEEALEGAAGVYAMTEHWIGTPDGSRLSAVLLRQPGARGTILYFGGNGFTIERFGAYVAGALAPLGVDIMIVDHRGYGRSEGTPTQANIEADGVAAFDYLSGTIGVAPARIVVHGQSLGSFIAGHVAANRPAAGVVLESSATTAEEWVDANFRGVARTFVRRGSIRRFRGAATGATWRRSGSRCCFWSAPRIGRRRPGSARRSTPPRRCPLPKTLLVVPGADHTDVLVHQEAIAAYRRFLAAAFAEE